MIQQQQQHPFGGLFSRTTWVIQHQKGKPFWISMKLDHMQIICTLLQTDNHTSTFSLSLSLSSVFCCRAGSEYPMDILS